MTRVNPSAFRRIEVRRARSRRSTEGIGRVGAATVEFAMVAPLMIMLTMGMIEVGRMVMAKQLMVNASREGARLGVLPGISNQEVIDRVQEELQSASITGVTVTVTPAGLSTAEAGTPVTVQLTVPATQVSWLSNPMFSVAQDITASTTMRREN